MKEHFRSILMIICVATMYLALAAYGWGTQHFLLVPIGLLLALVVVRSFFAWLSPNPPKRPWLGWVWLPLTLVPAAVGAFFWLQDHL